MRYSTRSHGTPVFGVLLLGLMLLARPAVAQVMVTGQTLQERAAAAGSGYRGTIAVANTTSTAQSVRLYQTDYHFDVSGQTQYPPLGTQPRSNAGWIELDATYVTLQPGEQRDIAYRVVVPSGGTLAGTYWSMIMVEGEATGMPASPPRPATAAEYRDGNGNGNGNGNGAAAANAAGSAAGHGADAVWFSASVRSVIRYAVQVVTHVGDASVQQLRFAAPSLANAADGGRNFALNVTNEGERAGRVTMQLELYDAAGVMVHGAEQRVGMLYPGTGRRPLFELGALAAGEYRAIVIGDVAGGDLVGAQFRLVIEH